MVLTNPVLTTKEHSTTGLITCLFHATSHLELLGDPTFNELQNAVSANQ
jgi:hypothetical protein